MGQSTQYFSGVNVHSSLFFPTNQAHSIYWPMKWWWSNIEDHMTNEWDALCSVSFRPVIVLGIHCWWPIGTGGTFGGQLILIFHHHHQIVLMSDLKCCILLISSVAFYCFKDSEHHNLSFFRNKERINPTSPLIERFFWYFSSHLQQKWSQSVGNNCRKIVSFGTMNSPKIERSSHDRFRVCIERCFVWVNRSANVIGLYKKRKSEIHDKMNLCALKSKWFVFGV